MSTNLFLQTTWAYFKKYWQTILAVGLGIVGYIIFRQNQVDFAKRLEEIQASHDAEIKRINDAREEERRAHEINIKKLQDALDIVQKHYDDAKKQLDDAKKQEIKTIVKTYGNDPVALAQQLSAATGFTIIMPE